MIVLSWPVLGSARWKLCAPDLREDTRVKRKKVTVPSRRLRLASWCAAGAILGMLSISTAGHAATGKTQPGASSRAPAEKPGTGINGEAMRSVLGELGYTFERTSLGLEARAPTGIFTVIMSGPDEDLTWLGAMMGVPDDKGVRAASVMQMLVFLNLVFPDWEGRAEWVTANTPSSFDDEVSVERGGRRLTMQSIRSLGCSGCLGGG